MATLILDLRPTGELPPAVSIRHYAMAVFRASGHDIDDVDLLDAEAWMGTGRYVYRHGDLTVVVDDRTPEER